MRVNRDTAFGQLAAERLQGVGGGDVETTLPSGITPHVARAVTPATAGEQPIGLDPATGFGPRAPRTADGVLDPCGCFCTGKHAWWGMIER